MQIKFSNIPGRQLSISASSYLKETSATHYPERAFDGDKNTAWVEGATGDGIGDYIEVYSPEAAILSRFQ